MLLQIISQLGRKSDLSLEFPPTPRPPAQGLRIHCALILLAKKKHTHTQEKHVFCPTEGGTSSLTHARVINLWECLRKPLIKALPTPLHRRLTPCSYQSPPSTGSHILHQGRPAWNTSESFLSLGFFFCLSPLRSELDSQDLEEGKDPLSSLPPICRVMGGSSGREISHSIRLTVQLQCR